jgi:hypothetical protein
MNAIKEILVNGGYITAAHHQELAADFPRLVVCIKWGQAQRESTTLGELDNAIKRGEARADYVREVFVPAYIHSQLRSCFGVTEEDGIEYYKGL